MHTKNLKKILKGKTLLITGGTGSFGRCFILYLLKNFNLKRIIIYSRDEKKQFDMAQSNDFNPHKYKELRYFIGDVRDYDRLDYAMEGCDYVVHAAAMKHVEVAEYNPMEAIKTNVHGADNIIKSALKNNIKKILALSTDKAVNPVNLYGATKLASDKLFIAANNIVGKKNCAFSIVRYGNVVGSRGSVIEIFRKIKNEKLKSYPITHESMTRFWITLEDSVKFVLSSLLGMKGGEVFVPKISSINIKDLVFAFDQNAKIKIIGLRPGEKLHEVLLSKEDSENAIEYKKFFIVKPQIKFTSVNESYIRMPWGEKGKPHKPGKEYNSSNNKDFLSIKDLKKNI
jgi:UDP-N-acetylglucosamine 4,6-dehydratase/5-epimerase